VRVNAFRALAPTNDAVAIELLGDSVREGTDGPVPLAEAIDLLDLAGSTGHLSLLRPLLDHPDLEVQMQAVKALGVDPASHDAIIAILEDRGRPTALRVQALRGLKRSDPGFVARAVRLIDDRSEAVEVREAALHYAVGYLNYHQVPAADQAALARAVERMAQTEPELMRRYDSTPAAILDYLRRHFPAAAKPAGEGDGG
jgi:hypothetical protein